MEIVFHFSRYFGCGKSEASPVVGNSTQLFNLTKMNFKGVDIHTNIRGRPLLSYLNTFSGICQFLSLPCGSPNPDVDSASTTLLAGIYDRGEYWMPSSIRTANGLIHQSAGLRGLRDSQISPYRLIG